MNKREGSCVNTLSLNILKSLRERNRNLRDIDLTILNRMNTIRSLKCTLNFELVSFNHLPTPFLLSFLFLRSELLLTYFRNFIFLIVIELFHNLLHFIIIFNRLIHLREIKRLCLLLEVLHRNRSLRNSEERFIIIFILLLSKLRKRVFSIELTIFCNLFLILFNELLFNHFISNSLCLWKHIFFNIALNAFNCSINCILLFTHVSFLNCFHRNLDS